MIRWWLDVQINCIYTHVKRGTISASEWECPRLPMWKHAHGLLLRQGAVVSAASGTLPCLCHQPSWVLHPWQTQSHRHQAPSRGNRASLPEEPPVISESRRTLSPQVAFLFPDCPETSGPLRLGPVALGASRGRQRFLLEPAPGLPAQVLPTMVGSFFPGCGQGTNACFFFSEPGQRCLMKTTASSTMASGLHKKGSHLLNVL